MARRKKNKGASTEANTVDYRYPHEKRTNIPPGRIAGEGTVPKIPKARYSYSPHLPPTLQFDSMGGPDKLNALLDKATRAPIGAAEAQLIRDALRQQEPWLEWSGKRERQWFEVDPVALHMHERISTQAILRVAAREDVERDLFADPQQDYAKAVQFYQHDMDWTNRMILGDSLQIMASLARRENLAGKVQMIYLDPPYGIKFASNFQPNLGQRNVKDRDQDLTREPETVKAYRDTWMLGIHSYLAYLRDRLTLARELLGDRGSIFLQISDENTHRVRQVMDEVFGPSNFCAEIAFRKTTGIESGFLASSKDWLLWYSKNREHAKFRRLFREKVPGEAGAEQFEWIEEESGIIRPAEPSEMSGQDLPRSGPQLFAHNDPTAVGSATTTYFAMSFAGREFRIPENRRWRTPIDGMNRLAAAGRLMSMGDSLRYKRYLKDHEVFAVTDWWEDTGISGFGEKKIYVVQTSPKVIERCMLMTTDPGDLVLDPTCGSGTTAYVAEQWGRRWITFDSSRVALALAKHRLMTAKFDYHQLRPLDADDIERNPTGAWLTDPTDTIPGKATFKCKTVPHITLKSIARNTALDPIFAKHVPILAEQLQKLNREVAKLGPALKDKLVAKLTQKHREQGTNAVTDGDIRRWLLPDTQSTLVKTIPARKPLRGVTPKQAEAYRAAIPKSGWKEWEVPFDTDTDWPEPLQDALVAYRAAWRAKMDEVNTCIAANAEMEELVNKPELVKGVVRVSGPFTVEGVRPEELNPGEGGLVADPAGGHEGEEDGSAAAINQQNVQAYLRQMVQLIKQDGLTFLNNKRRRFANVESLFDAATGAVLHAEGSWDDSSSPEVLDVAIGFGPQYGPVTAEQVEGLIHACKRYSELVVAGFSFDADATALVQEQSHPKLRIHQAYIRPDINPGMAGLLKETPDSQLFTVFGTPEIEIAEDEEGDWVVHLKGVDVYDPVANTIRSTGADKVAAWFLDSDFDGRCFCISQAFFPNQDAWEKIAKALGSAADMDAFEAFKGTTSIPFPVGKYKRVAVKVIDPRGNEVMAVRALKA
jgi:adenine-specific DNA-methyltransferase